jgi:hypothetical protein
MQACKDFLLKNNFIAIRQEKVKSKTDENVFYTVSEYRDGKYSCDCVAGTMNRPCRHVRIIQNKKKGIII